MRKAADCATGILDVAPVDVMAKVGWVGKTVTGAAALGECGIVAGIIWVLAEVRWDVCGPVWSFNDGSG